MIWICIFVDSSPKDYSSQYNALYFFSFSKGEDLHSVICGSFFCPPYSKCESAGVCVCTQCTHDGKKVCGSDGKTYDDLCELQRVACESNAPLKMTRKGSCQGRFPLLHFVSLLRSTFRGEGSDKENPKYNRDGIKEQEALTIYTENTEIRVGKRMGQTIPLGTL